MKAKATTATTATTIDRARPVSEILHVWALAPAAIGACCLAADRRRARAPELFASMLMLSAMLDAAALHRIAGVYWAAMLLTAAVVLAAVRGPRRPRRRGRPAATPGMTTHTALGLVVMAVLTVFLPHGYDPVREAHAHGLSTGTTTSLLGAGSLAYVAWSAAGAVRHAGADRAQFVTMGVSTAVMAAALVM